ncbi:MAG: acyltransferase family protein [Janthinobacterium lividum]
MPVSAPLSPPKSPQPARLRLDYLDGLRGLAALYVVMHHAYYGLTAEAALPPLAAFLTYWLYLGRSAVDIFIVLSGYCLMLPVVRSGRMSRSFAEFIQRRARRILPPYYAALALSLIVIALVPALHDLSHPAALWNEALPAFIPSVIISHLLLVHNFDPDWHSKIDYPMWSVATEWQIYFLFPLALLPIWRRWGAAACVAAAFVIGLVPLFLFFDRFSGVSPQFLGLFALGMAAADFNFSQKPLLVRGRERLPWGAFSALLVVVLVLVSLKHSDWPGNVVLKDIFVGAATACLLVACTRSLTRRHETATDQSPGTCGYASLALRLMESRPAVLLGTFSYSLYLVHAPVLAVCQSALRPLHLAPIPALGIMLAVGVPLALVVSYLFHLAFEKPFLSHALVTAEKKLSQ